MLIYLDSMIIQYVADHIDYISALGGYRRVEDVDTTRLPVRDPRLMREIRALGRLAFLEQLGDSWT